MDRERDDRGVRTELESEASVPSTAPRRAVGVRLHRRPDPAARERVVQLLADLLAGRLS